MPAPGDAAVDAFLRRHLDAVDGPTLEDLREGPVIAPGHQEIAFSDGVYATPSGRIELVSAEAARRWGVDALPSYDEPEEGRRSAPPEMRAAYPLHFMTPNTKNRIHSQFNNLRSIRMFSPAPTLQIHPDDAAPRGIAQGGKVRVFNDRGHVEVAASLDHGIRPGCVSMTNGWWITEGGSVNFCSLGRETDMGHGAAFHDNLVQVERVG
jgi:anaerobic selenocysteine-containing dehydrogenase